MATYIIGMQFISWMMAIMSVMGFLFIKAVEYDLSNPDSKTDDIVRIGANKVLQD
jgi:hypothetical protein